MTRRVVVTGIGAVSPLGNTAASTWQAMVQGVNGVGPLTRFDNSAGKVSVAAEVKGFDPLLYFEKAEVRKNDLFTQYAVAAATQAVEDAGISGKVEPTRFGVYMGSGIGGISTTEAETLRLFNGKRVSPFMIPMMIANMAAGVISLRFNAQGPTLPVVTACATGSHTIGEAYRAIRHGYADTIIAGGSEAAITPLAVGGFTSCMALTTNPNPETACRPFDKNRDGFVIGEGGAALVLEEYQQAKKRGAHIYGEIKGYGNTADAYHITAPHPEARGIISAIRNALTEAELTPTDTTYVNAHGTSTQLNDKSETVAFKQVFGTAATKVAISSTKSMTGHLLGGAGALEAIACLKAMESGIVPPTIHLQQPDENCNLNYTPNQACARPLDNAISTSLGFGGHNACLVFASARGL